MLKMPKQCISCSKHYCACISSIAVAPADWEISAISSQHRSNKLRYDIKLSYADRTIDETYRILGHNERSQFPGCFFPCLRSHNNIWRHIIQTWLLPPRLIAGIPNTSFSTFYLHSFHFFWCFFFSPLQFVPVCQCQS